MVKDKDWNICSAFGGLFRTSPLLCHLRVTWWSFYPRRGCGWRIGWTVDNGKVDLREGMGWDDGLQFGRSKANGIITTWLFLT
ncbi:hypothetical protein CEXT_742011 [Caerostris extrusa]|uniref:Uncharacterized protein n=1 Tax=Caerostris extrusa TaxID=172846 RepID=A0AAV4M6T2_CAEEX|nr:hypothetical protein CEXT_742011 [Caerostris extrusa]